MASDIIQIAHIRPAINITKKGIDSVPTPVIFFLFV